MKLTFFGGARMVTGANYMLESGETRILIDCGLHQGSNFCEKHNWEPFPYRPEDIAAAFVTHAHIDHTGRLPKLMRDGFRGAVYSTPPTRDASALLLTDADHILAQDAAHFKRPPLYGQSDVDRLLRAWQGMPYHQEITVGPFRVTLWNAGHVLGSSFIEVLAEGKTILFSGDLGNAPAPLIGPYETFAGPADFAVVESTYGDRNHEDAAERKEILEDMIEDTVRAGGVLMIPAFAMERTQELLYEIDDLAEHGRIPSVPLFLDSPLAIKLTEVYERHASYFDPSARTLIHGKKMFDFPNLKKTLTTDESKAINDVPAPKIVIAGSGMSHGGRIIHHERRYISDHKSTLLIVGYQAIGSLGRMILDGARSVKIFGEEIPVRCRVRALGGYSAHADQRQLIAWLAPLRFKLRRAFVVQGEPDASKTLAERLIDDLALEAVVPEQNEEVVL